MIKLLVALLLLPGPALCQQVIDNSTAARVRPYPVVYSFPGSCKYGDHVTYMGSGHPVDYVCDVDNTTWNISSGGGGNPTNGTNGQVLVSNGAGGFGTPSSPAVTIDSAGNVTTGGTITAGSAGNSSFSQFFGATSGSTGWIAANVAGTPIFYQMPTAPATNGVLTDGGAVTCPMGSPLTNCHATNWSGGAVTTVVSTPVNTVTLNIPQTGTNFIISVQGQTTGTGANDPDTMQMVFNHDTSNDYDLTSQYINTSGNPVAAALKNQSSIPCCIFTGSTLGGLYDGFATIKIFGYQAATFYKGGHFENFSPGNNGINNLNSSSGGFEWHPGSAAAISTVTFTLGSGGNFKTGFIFTVEVK